MRIELSRAEQEKAIKLYLQNKGMIFKDIKCKFSRETVVVEIDDEVDTTPTVNLDSTVEKNTVLLEETTPFQFGE